MMRRNRFIFTLSALAASAALVACGEEPPPVVTAPPPPPKPTAPPPPPVTPIADLMAKYDIDQRVNLPEDEAPKTDVERIAVLKFYDAFARGNAEGLKEMLSSADQAELTRIVESGAFKSSTESITRIDVRCGNQDSDRCALAVFHVGEDFEPQLWTYSAGSTSTEFDSVASPPDIMNKLSGDDHIAAWYAIVKAELAKADEPDVVLEIPQKDFTKIETASSEGGGDGAPTGPVGPSSPGGAPGKRAPGAPIKAPKPPGFGQQ
jgi:hypothetical protein